MDIAIFQGLVGLVLVVAGFLMRDQWLFGLGLVFYLAAEIKLNR